MDGELVNSRGYKHDDYIPHDTRCERFYADEKTKRNFDRMVEVIREKGPISVNEALKILGCKRSTFNTCLTNMTYWTPPIYHDYGEIGICE